MEDSRSKQRQAFLDIYFADENYKIQPLAADASFRTYDRIISGDNSFILMNSPPQHYALDKFTDIAAFLYNHGFSAPKLFKEDQARGFLLLEDFGTTSINNYLCNNKTEDNRFKIYQLIIDLLCEIQKLNSPKNLPIYDQQLLLKELEIYSEWYLSYENSISLSQTDKNELYKIWQDILSKLPDLGSCFVHRDFHVDNLMLLPRKGTAAIGILDFQDALLGSPLYDIVSLLEDARVDVESDFAKQCLDYYLQKNIHLDKQDALLAYNILGAQRNSRVLGVFIRKYKRDNQANFLQYIPRVEGYLKNNLKHEIFGNLKNWLKSKKYITADVFSK